MSARVRYKKGDLDRKLAEAGIGFDEFAAKAGIGRETLRRARQGRNLSNKSFGRILVALAHTQALNGSGPAEKAS